MYFVKRTVGQQEEPGEIDWGPLWRVLDFQELINYQERKNDLIAVRKGDHRPLPPELVAAAHAHIDYRSRQFGGAKASAALNRLADTALHYCELMLYEQGYIPKPIGQISPGGDTTNLLVVPGAQARDILESRVSAAVGLLRQLGEMQQIQATIVFSGKNPAEAKFGKTQTPDEAVQMVALFEKEVTKKEIPKEQHRWWRTKLENRSTNSDENLRNTLSPTYLEETDGPIWLYIVSSTFHLPRLARVAEEIIEERNLSRIEQIVAVTAEGEVESDPVVGTARYLKWMMFVVYDHILDHSTRKDLADSRRFIQKAPRI